MASSSISRLTAGSCIRLHNAASNASLFDATHILQILSIDGGGSNTTSNNSNNGSPYRLSVSDGEHVMQAMLATQLDYFVMENLIKNHTVVNVTKMSSNVVENRRLITILSLTVIEHVSAKIGSPTSIASESTPHPTSSFADRSIYPIEGLSPYQNHWMIKARVVQKSDLNTFSNQKGKGHLFNATLMDDTGQIKATAFNAIATALYDKLQDGKVYLISGARVTIAKKQFSALKHEYELLLDKNTDIEECLDASVPNITYDFVPLGELEKQAENSTCDIIAVVKKVGPIREITTKGTNRQILKRELSLVDSSGFSVRMTLWSKQAERFNSPEAVVAFKSVKVGDYGGRSLSFSGSSTMALNPDIQSAHSLRSWYDENGRNVAYQTHRSSGGAVTKFQRNNICSILEVKNTAANSLELDKDFSTRATIVFMKPDTMWYPACQNPDCNKKVAQAMDGTWRCEKCNQSYAKPKYRYIVSMACADWSDQAWLQGFNDVGETIFGMTADEMVALKAKDESAFTSAVQEATCETYNFVCRGKDQASSGQRRMRLGISEIHPLNYKEEATALRDWIHSECGGTHI
ncbi:replication factor-A C terminal domain-containing protein [Mycena polygramma]|nr:replication factor-A C terminal domain-containing protein [Mycena polygramma]